MIYRRGPRRRRRRTQDPVLRAQQDWVVYGQPFNIWRDGSRAASQYDAAFDRAKRLHPDAGPKPNDPKPSTF